MDRGGARNMKETQKRKSIRRKRRIYLYFYGIAYSW
jgi:hypothetical protein